MRGVALTISHVGLVTALGIGAVASTVILADRGSWFWAVLAGTMQLTCLAQWWLSRREGGAAAKTADRFLGLLVATLLVFYYATLTN